MNKTLNLGKTSKLRTIFLDVILVTAACALFAVCFNVFLAPANIYSRAGYNVNLSGTAEDLRRNRAGQTQ